MQNHSGLVQQCDVPGQLMYMVSLNARQTKPVVQLVTPYELVTLASCVSVSITTKQSVCVIGIFQPRANAFGNFVDLFYLNNKLQSELGLRQSLHVFGILYSSPQLIVDRSLSVISIGICKLLYVLQLIKATGSNIAWQWYTRFRYTICSLQLIVPWYSHMSVWI